MAINTIHTTKSTVKNRESGATITIFHCFNALPDISIPDDAKCEINTVKMPCSSMTREVFLLRAFEAGADAVIVLVCPEGSCHYVTGNIRAAKRVARTKKILDDIGLGGNRLNIFNIKEGDQAAIKAIITQTVSDLSTFKPFPSL